jgi:glucosamine--fructose-6-phosphate aminotransferase (isomerizing)
MCGIVAYKGRQQCLPFLLDGLKKLEYRGYDSVGLAYKVDDKIELVKQIGRIENLTLSVPLSTPSFMGMGHTRWATHGKPSLENCHPHVSPDESLYLVHNGIITNYESLRVKNYAYYGNTDSEVLLSVIYTEFIKHHDLAECVKTCLKKVEGSYAIVIMSASSMIVACKNSSLVIGMGSDGYYVASDCGALEDYADKVVFLGENTVGEIGQDLKLWNLLDNSMIEYRSEVLNNKNSKISKGNYDHFMLKEIYEQSEVVNECLRGRLFDDVRLDELEKYKDRFYGCNTVTLLGCGSSYYACLLGKYYLEELCGIKCLVESAGEFSNRHPVISKRDVVICLSQSGETADLLNAVRLAKSYNCCVISICNTDNSSLTKLSDSYILCRAGVEVGVASTKGFTSQVLVLLLIALWLNSNKLTNHLNALSFYIGETLKLSSRIKRDVAYYSSMERFLFVGKKYNYPIALEGALKLKEISYSSAEGYASSEMKHGPIALVDKNTLVVGVGGSEIDHTIEEIKARDGNVIRVGPVGNNIDWGVSDVPEELCPLLYVIVLQLFSYHYAVMKDKDVDKPRNLAKSVTVI